LACGDFTLVIRFSLIAQIEELSHAAELLIPRRDENLYRLIAENHQFAIENFVEDPLGEELLKGEFQGKDTINVDVKKVGEQRQLVFVGTNSAAEAAPVAATAPGTGGAS